MSAATAVFVRDTPVFVESETGRIAKFPATRGARWALRGLISVPFLALAFAYQAASGGDWSGTANGALVERVSQLPWGSTSIDVVGQLYPLLSSTLAVLVPGGALGLAVVDALIAGFLVQLVIQSLRRKGFPLSVRLVFALTLGLTPVFAYIVTTNFETTLGLLFLGLGMVDTVRFVTYANTQAGFRAGLLFAASAFSDSTGLFAALVAAVAATFIVRSRVGSRFANALVVVFPTVSLFFALAVVGVAFRLGPLFMIRGDLSWNPERFAQVSSYLATPDGWVYLAPTAIVMIAAVALGRAGVGLAALLVTVTTLLAYVVGLTPPGVAGNNYVFMLFICVAVVPAARTRLEALLICGISVLLFALGWIDALTTPALVTWTHVLIPGGHA